MLIFCEESTFELFIMLYELTRYSRDSNRLQQGINASFHVKKRVRNMKIKKIRLQSRVSYKRRGRNRDTVRTSEMFATTKFPSLDSKVFRKFPRAIRARFAICRFHVYVKTVTLTTYIIY